MSIRTATRKSFSELNPEEIQSIREFFRQEGERLISHAANPSTSSTVEDLINSLAVVNVGNINNDNNNNNNNSNNNLPVLLNTTSVS